MSTSRATTKNPELLFFGGKGGVGKTTCAAAWAVAAARAGRRVLVISTDPAHSLGDALDASLSHRIRKVNVRRSASRTRHTAPCVVEAVELDAPLAFARWLTEHRRALGDALEHGTWLDRGDIDALVSLPIPGVDELVGMLEIVSLCASAKYDTVIVDTAPTGHSLRMLASPEAVGRVSAVLDELQHEHRVIRQQFARVVRSEAADRLIEVLATQARDTATLLRDSKRTAFHWVLLPEILSVDETIDALAALRRARLPVSRLIVNRVVPDGGRCPVCDRRRAEERRVISRLRRLIGKTLALNTVADDGREPRGAERLAAVGAQLTRPAPIRLGARIPGRRLARGSAMSVASGTRPGVVQSLDQFRGARLLFFGGKGGVGKTTIAAAVALALARKSANGRVLLLSADPAHSVGDVFQVVAGDGPRQVPGAPANLYVRELDAGAALAARRTELQAAIEEIVAAFGVESVGDRGMTELLDLAPPGIDEVFGVLSVVDAHEQYETVVVDTAPTGHALRLLEMPDVAREWVQVLLRVLLKYRELVRPGLLAESLVEVSKSVRRLQVLIRDPAITRFVVVTRAAELPLMETERLLRHLRRLGLATPAVIVNARTLGPGTCVRCRKIEAAERQQAGRLATTLRRAGGRRVIIQTPLVVPPPRGVRALEGWGRAWLS